LPRSYYSNDIEIFLNTTEDDVLAKLTKNNQFTLEEKQRNSWLREIDILRNEIAKINQGRVLFEYSIPRMGKRADVILLLKDLVFILEFKINSHEYKNSDLDQVLGYALDLKYFHDESHNAKLVPILIATDAPNFPNDIQRYEDGVFKPLKCNKTNLGTTIETLLAEFETGKLDAEKWENSL
jgi:hypothetical protein